MLRTTLPLLAALSVFVAAFSASADALACERTNVDDVVIRDRVVRDRVNVRPIAVDETLARAAELDREARMAEQRAGAHASRAQSLRQAAATLEENVPVSFGEAREVILERIDALLERAALETGQARSERVRAGELRAEAARLRQLARGNGGGGWRGKRSLPADVVTPQAVDI